MSRIRTGNRQLIRELNTNLVINQIRQSDPVSQADIMKRTRLSAGTVTSIVKELKDREFVQDIGPGESSIGRKPTLLRFNAQARYVIGAAFFADQTHLAILDLGGNIKKQVEFPTKPKSGPDVLFAEFCQQANRLVADTGVPRERLLGIGVGFEGIVDHVTGQLLLSTRFGWRNVPVKEEIERNFGIKTVVNSEGAAMALVAEGVDLLDISGGLCGAAPPEWDQVSQGYFVPMASEIQAAVGVPIVVAGGITDPAFANRVIREGRVSLVAIGRAMLANPDWATDARRQLLGES